VLREAYKQTVTDPALLKDAQKIGLDFDPAYGADVQKMIYDALHQPEENVKMLKEIIKIE
jgi:hypothetical protein